MKQNSVALFLFYLFALPLISLADSKSQPMAEARRQEIISYFVAEKPFSKKMFPPPGKNGKKGLTIKNGVVSPSDAEVRQEAYKGIPMPSGQQTLPPSVRLPVPVDIGDKVKVTDVKFNKKSIRFELNGGPTKKQKWYEHIQVQSKGGASGIPAPPTEEHPTGTFIEIVFDDYVPDISPEELKKILSLILNFRAVSTAEAYLEVIPPVVKEAIKNHEALVGMDREMLIYAKGKPPRKIREKDEDGAEYEEWIYGTPPQDVVFVRFIGDYVVMIKTMKITGEKIVATKPVPEIVDYFRKRQSIAVDNPTPTTPQKQPTLMRPGEDKPNVTPEAGPPVLPCKEGQTQNCRPVPPDASPPQRPE